jgi:hypothetical protein
MKINGLPVGVQEALRPHRPAYRAYRLLVRPSPLGVIRTKERDGA